jgi:hypothetical protein
MIRTILSGVIAVHGIIHLIGLLKAWSLGSAEKISAKAIFNLPPSDTKLVGVLWLLTCILLIMSTYAFYFRKEWFWIVGVVAFVISQALIILHWPEAKWGTLANVILLFAIVLAAARVSFDKMVEKEVNHLISLSSTKPSTVSEEKVSTLPGAVQTWLRKSGVVGHRIPSTVLITQHGSMRADPNGEWMTFEAVEYFSIDPPAFVWKATIHTDKYIDIAGRDKYENGKGNMLIKAASLIPIANSSGVEIDEGTLIRFMAEVIWFPHAAVSDYLSWEEIDSTHARVTMSNEGVTASGICTFNEEGFPVGFEAPRYRELNGKFTKEIWSVKSSGFGKYEGLPIAKESEVIWKLKDGDFSWLRLTIADVQYSY